MTKEEKRKAIMESLQKDYAKDLKEFGQIENMLFGHVVQIMHNLATISAIFATGTMVLLSSKVVPADTDLVIIGIVVLLLEVFFIFWYLFHYHGKDTKSFLQEKKKQINPSANLILKYYDYQSGKITGEQFDAEVLTTALTAKANVIKANLEIINKRQSTNYWDSFFVGWLSLGVIFIIIGLLGPSIQLLMGK